VLAVCFQGLVGGKFFRALLFPRISLSHGSSRKRILLLDTSLFVAAERNYWSMLNKDPAHRRVSRISILG
jgi:hypothetical protein